MERIRRLERSKWREREKRKRNIIKRLKKGEGEIEEKIKEIKNRNGKNRSGSEDRKDKKDRGG